MAIRSFPHTLYIEVISVIYVVQPGDTLSSIARQFDVSVASVRNRNQIPVGAPLVVGQALLILNSIKTTPLSIQVNGYAYPFISPFVLRESLTRLNLLSVFSYGFLPDGTLLPPFLGDDRLLQAARQAGVEASLVLTPFGPDGQFNNVLVNSLLANPAAQERLLSQLQTVMTQKGYAELNIDFEFVLEEDRVAFADFVALAADTLEYRVSVCLAPKTSAEQRGILVSGKDYRLLGQAVDRVLLMTYEWGYKYGEPFAVAPLDKVRQVVEYAVTEIPTEKISLGLANYGYDWPLPFQRGQTVARTIGNVEAVELARRVGAEIQFDEPSQSPWFSYQNRGVDHVVWFEDVRSWQAKCDLVAEFGLTGVGIWQLQSLFRAGLDLLGENFRYPLGLSVG